MGFSILLELPFFLISVLDGNIIYSYLPFISSVLHIEQPMSFFVQLEL